MNQEAAYQRDVFLRTLLSELRSEVPGVEFTAEQPLAHLISHMMSGVKAQIAVKVFGDDLDKLRELAEQIRSTVAQVEGVTPPIIDPQERVDELHIVLRPGGPFSFPILASDRNSDPFPYFATLSMAANARI